MGRERGRGQAQAQSGARARAGGGGLAATMERRKCFGCFYVARVMILIFMFMFMFMCCLDEMGQLMMIGVDVGDVSYSYDRYVVMTHI